ncbi:GNAT family N-acetyltransferase [Erythrobacter sp. sf7]|uniref:GNAT family N-acetyltransferase n=1 Tax=Erythrobacter fulvus TaxID=2987523 RepID=A0ABT5JSZ4_9SPHN|nr:GNAT family N-acetyltransferase [Erythrobacter fulvus]MDC8755616.1 GNAT family N-acetyltransferase [Erythrobacter fulvus]
MYESRIAADRITVTAVEGFAPEIDALADRALARRGFLRAAWYRGGAGQHPGRTLLIRRGDENGEIIAALPTVALGPAIGRLRKVPGAYWPFRGAPVAEDCNPVELAQGLERAGPKLLGRVLRLGPVRMDDPANQMLIAAAQLAGWTVLSRPAGTSWLIDLKQARSQGWPRPSTAKRLARAERRLQKLGTVAWHHVRGAGWNDQVFEQLAAVEAASWIASSTDTRGAKFLTETQRGIWRTAIADPVLAEMLCATILTIDGRAVAFSFDCDDGAVQYGIAGTYVSDLGKYDVGKIVNYRAVSDAIDDGQSVMDLGAGDSGYKREMGAVAGYDMADLLLVRSRPLAKLIARLWGDELQRSGSSALTPKVLVDA